MKCPSGWPLVPLLWSLACAAPAPQPVEPGQTTTGSPARPNLVMVVVDDLRWDEFGAAGHPYLETPGMDA